MNRIKKLVRNTMIIILVLIGFYYYGGFYLSREEYIKDYLKGFYRKENEYILEFNYKNRYKSIIADLDNKTYAVIGTRKIGFLYVSDGSYKYEIDIEKIIDTKYVYDSDMNGLILFIYRNNDQVDYVIFESKDGEKYKIDDWNKNFSIIKIDGNFSNLSVEGIYKIYDKNNQLIEEVIQY